MAASVIIVEDESLLRRSLGRFLESQEFEVLLAASGSEGLERIAENQVDVAILDLKLPDMDGLEVLEEIRNRNPGIAVVIVTAHGNVETAVEAMKLGAVDYLNKPLDLDELRLVIGRSLQVGKLKRRLAHINEESRKGAELQNLLGESDPMKAVKKRIRRIIDSPSSTVLVQGETGTGKELVARAIHYESQRAVEPFIEVNCAAIPSHLLESELLGHERGAFTDARMRKRGLLELADNGSLFLDEVGQLPDGLQAKLLRVLETKSFRRVGGTEDISVDVRIVAATNDDLEANIREGTFREDLFYRLNVLNVVLPPLRERGKDVLLLARHFLELYGNEYGRPVAELSPGAAESLMAYEWPGNVRELRNVMERVVLLHSTDVLREEHLEFGSITATGSSTGGQVKVGEDTSVEVSFGEDGISFEAVERRLLEAALRTAEGNQSEAARLLGLTRDTLRYRVQRYDIDPHRYRKVEGES